MLISVVITRAKGYGAGNPELAVDSSNLFVYILSKPFLYFLEKLVYWTAPEAPREAPSIPYVFKGHLQKSTKQGGGGSVRACIKIMMGVGVENNDQVSKQITHFWGFHTAGSLPSCIIPHNFPRKVALLLLTLHISTNLYSIFHLEISSHF